MQNNEENSNINLTQLKVEKPANKIPNEAGSIYVTGFVRITDPNTKEVFLETRE